MLEDNLVLGGRRRKPPPSKIQVPYIFSILSASFLEQVQHSAHPDILEKQRF